ncbi:MAG: hypothetical protein KKG59_03930 [Nanoarchaeota archaeon]|nr:hypothetical protein [Nanoarchaeota archaeon]
MKKTILMAFALMILAIPVLALQGTTTNIVIYSPLNNTSIGLQSQDFTFEIDGPEDASSCSFIADGDILKTYPTIPHRIDRKFTVQLPQGQHEWKINCVFPDGEIESETRILNVDLTGLPTGCVEKQSMGSGKFRHVFDKECAEQTPVTIQGLRPNDWIEITLEETSRLPGGRFETKTNYFILYLIKLSVRNGQDFFQYNTNRNTAKVDALVGEAVEVDIDGDDINDITLTVNEIYLKKASVTIRMLDVDYDAPVISDDPDMVDEEDVEPVEPVILDDEDEPEEMDDVVDDLVTDDEEETTGSNPAKLWSTIIIIMVLLAILVYLTVSQRKEKKTKQVKRKAPQGKKADFIIESSAKAKRKRRR